MAGAERPGPVEVRTRIDAAPETIFDFFTEPDKMILWMGRRAELRPTPGGVFRCEINDSHFASGEFVELEPPHRLVFSWGWEGEDASVAPGASTVEVRLVPDGPRTEVVLTHRDLPSAEAAASHGRGWSHYGARLAAAATGEDPGPDPWADPGTAGT